MNDQLQQFARQSLKEGLAKLPDAWQNTFKMMYGREHVGGLRSMEETRAMPINDVVDAMPDEKLDWAMQQIQNSIKKLDQTGAA